MEKLTCRGAKQIDLVDYLASLGHQPQKVNNQDYWYLSPLRDEKTPSFKINRKLNVWYDHATGKGGNAKGSFKSYRCAQPHGRQH